MQGPNFFVSAILTSLLILSSSDVLAGLSDAGRSSSSPIRESGWRTLTKWNFSSEIRRHPHILLMITLPWSGETRSLMKEVSHLVADKQDELGYLKLRVVYRNSEKILADVLGAAEGITLFYYHHSKSYKYQGHLRARNIMTSIYHFISLPTEEVPLKPLHTQDDLEFFFQSTDKAVLLLEFCGWSTKLLHEEKKGNNDTILPAENQLDIASILGERISRESDKILTFDKKNLKSLEDVELTCNAENSFPGYPWHEEFTRGNQSASQAAEDVHFGIKGSCTLEEFHKFQSFFSNFATTARKYYLPLGRQRYGLVLDRSLVPFLGVDNPKTWLLMLHFPGCVNCSIVFQEGDDLGTFIRSDNSIVMELDADGKNLAPMFPADRPSVILFVDRSSDLAKVRGESKSSLEVLRRFAHHNQLSYSIDSESSSAEPSFGTWRQSISDRPGHWDRKDQEAPQFVKLKDKMSNILAYLLQQGNPRFKIKEKKISLIAKEVGFQLLSDDFEVQALDSLPSHKEADQFEEMVTDAISSDEIFQESIENDISTNNDDLGKSSTNLAEEVHDGVAKCTEVEDNDKSYMQEDQGPYTCQAEEQLLVSEEYIEQEHAGQIDSQNLPSDISGMASLGDDDAEKTKVPMITRQISEPHAHRRPFLGSVLYSDGGYQLLRALTGGSRIPSLVILDPVLQQHYVFSEEEEMNYSSLVSFIDEFLNSSLTPYRKSASPSVNPREAPRPPFVNLDFRETDSLPRVTANTFCELVVGYEHCEMGNELSSSNIQNFGPAWKMDVLVAFSTPWCGFCQRMELIVREVYRALKNFTNISRSRSRGMDPIHLQDKLEDTALDKLPSIYFMDCTENDCGSFLNPIGKKELYPALLLFPAENKSAISYEGDVSVVSIIEFLASYGSNSQHLNRHKGFLWVYASKGRQTGTRFHDASSLPTELTPYAEQKYDEALLGTSVGEKDHHPVGSHASNSLLNDNQHVVPGSVLVATDKLIDAFPFNNSTVLIVMADQTQGFLGLIVNNPASWDVFKGSEVLDLLRQALLFFGGPVRARGAPLVTLTRKPREGFIEVGEALYFGDPVATSTTIELIASGKDSAKDYYFFLGYSRWEWTQLFEELEEGAWHLTSAQFNI